MNDRAAHARRTRLACALRTFSLTLVASGAVLVGLPATGWAQALVMATVGGVGETLPTGTAQSSSATTYGNHAATARHGRLTIDHAISISENGSDSGLNSVASFQDDLTITDPVATGVGTLRARLRITGGPSYSATRTSGAVTQGANSSYQVLSIRNGGTFSFENGGILYNTSVVPAESIIGTVPAPGIVEVEYLFVFGSPVNVGMQLFGAAGGTNFFNEPEDGAISSNSNVTLVWDGIVAIEDSGGTNRLATATVSSASGTDWTGPFAPDVPTGPWLPIGLATALAALGTAQATRRGRRER